ncbi:hypothetical protein [Novosphingobium decolorationis]|uniref:Terminase small subunit n=1 Tax=Novosphingobium decolorationis TaxID=2698673 RepID=A0ABX8E9R8_9SPHN|nr:hypothetical protein [Novosphingobium decolorationis]MED5543743.1 hypothetical protein [Pseudomonadota bacterium]QVM84950.1 hypothetical protein HT578_15745 [Novosphingobium decolorationis]
MADTTSSAGGARPERTRAPAKKPAAPRNWRRRFLAELAATSNVSASAKAAGVASSTAYEARRDDPEFYRQWQEALCEGYDHLEMTLLQRLREGEIKPPTGAKRGTRVFDNATAFRLLTAHRESAARQRAIVENRNSEAILDSINAKIEKMRARSFDTAPSPAGNDGACDAQ